MMTYKSSSSAETKNIAWRLAVKVLKLKPKNHAVVIGLSGNLGTGKTTFIQGFLRALGVKKKVTSPTFVLIKRHAVNRKNFTHAYHADTYRLKNHADLKILDFKEIVSDPRNIVLVEWAEKVRKLLPKGTVWIRFSHGRKENERKIIFKY